MSIPKIRTPARVSREIPLKTPSRSSLLVVTHPDHVCLALSIGHGKSGHRLSSLSLDNDGRASLIAALLDWHYLPELPHEYHPVLLARGEGEIVKAFHARGTWFDCPRGLPLTGTCYAWARMPVAPANPNPPKP